MRRGCRARACPDMIDGVSLLLPHAELLDSLHLFHSSFSSSATSVFPFGVLDFGAYGRDESIRPHETLFLIRSIPTSLSTYRGHTDTPLDEQLLSFRNSIQDTLDLESWRLILIYILTYPIYFYACIFLLIHT